MYEPGVGLNKEVPLSLLSQREGSKDDTGYGGPSLEVGLAGGQYFGFRCVALVFIRIKVSTGTV